METKTRSPRFTCDCGKSYRWRLEIAGRQAKCPCGRTLRIPRSIEDLPSPPLGLGDLDAEPLPMRPALAVAR